MGIRHLAGSETKRAPAHLRLAQVAAGLQAQVDVQLGKQLERDEYLTVRLEAVGRGVEVAHA